MWNILWSETHAGHDFEDIHEEKGMILKLMIRRRACVLPDLIIGFQSPPFCQKNGMHYESNHNRF
jgi:hypothetical protein